MRVGFVLLLFLLAGLAGCADSTSTTGENSDTSEFCINGVCETCTDGVCTGELAERRAALAEPHSDTSVHEHHDLKPGFPESSWSFYVDANATASALIRVMEPVTQLAVPGGSACVRWEKMTATSESSDSAGQCNSGNTQVAINGPGDGTILDWSSLEPGHYVIRVSAQPQVNHLYVDIAVDNP